jgi:hypothetical protein
MNEQQQINKQSSSSLTYPSQLIHINQIETLLLLMIENEEDDELNEIRRACE